MTDAVVSCVAQRPRKRLPPGFGLLIGASASLGLWGGLFWLAGAIL